MTKRGAMSRRNPSGVRNKSDSPAAFFKECNKYALSKIRFDLDANVDRERRKVSTLCY